ncbi:hypothetical protein AFERRI_330004 [Acidithiobacillus ferrivorans]|uniref:Uncharacterized protein n=1 Tax=Acidithiobacillus ferrivorans TaxID=160808 RepID=A0A060UTE9_9PROT|nr:hypothetical protein AFERRI_330004 [Acidithiobacillus ferrivorans]
MSKLLTIKFLVNMIHALGNIYN